MARRRSANKGRVRRLIPLFVALCALGSFAQVAAAAEPPNQNDPCSRAGRNSCDTNGVGRYATYRYGLRWFGDYRKAVAGEDDPTFCIDLRFWYPRRSSSTASAPPRACATRSASGSPRRACLHELRPLEVRAQRSGHPPGRDDALRPPPHGRRRTRRDRPPARSVRRSRPPSTASPTRRRSSRARTASSPTSPRASPSARRASSPCG